MADHSSLHLANADNIAVIMGVTDGTADTALSTLALNPFKTTNVLCIPIGEGCYIEDDGSVRPRQSSTTATGIDVRSSATAKAYIVLVIHLGGGKAMTVDHSGTTT
jgi:hypothetical protein